MKMTFHELSIAARATLCALRAPEAELIELQIAEELTGRSALERLGARLRTSTDGSELLCRRPLLPPGKVELERLRGLAFGTLGSAYVRVLDSQAQRDPAAPKLRYLALETDAGYLLQRYRQSRPVWHGLLNLSTSRTESVLVDAFSFGQLELPLPALLAGAGAVRHLLARGRWRALTRTLVQAYRRGQGCEPLLPVMWERLWAEDLSSVRRRLGVEPLLPAAVFT